MASWKLIASPMPCSSGKLRVPRSSNLRMSPERGLSLQTSGQIFSILSDWIHSMPVPMGAERNLCRLVPK